jgi:hypothetical protein
VADDQGRQLTAFDVFERCSDAHLLRGEGLAAGEREASVGGEECSEALGGLGLDLGEATVGPVAGVGLHKPRILSGLQPNPTRDGVGRFAGAQQRAAPQRLKAVGHCPLGEFGGLFAAGVVERHLLLALEAALEVVGGLAVARQVDANRYRPILAGLAGAGLSHAALIRADRFERGGAQVEELIEHRGDGSP